MVKICDGLKASLSTIMAAKRIREEEIKRPRAQCERRRFPTLSSDWLPGWRMSTRREREEEAEEEEVEGCEGRRRKRRRKDSPVECSGGETEQLAFIPWEVSGPIPFQD